MFMAGYFSSLQRPSRLALRHVVGLDINIILWVTS